MDELSLMQLVDALVFHLTSKELRSRFIFVTKRALFESVVGV